MKVDGDGMVEQMIDLRSGIIKKLFTSIYKEILSSAKSSTSKFQHLNDNGMLMDAIIVQRTSS